MNEPLATPLAMLALFAVAAILAFIVGRLLAAMLELQRESLAMSGRMIDNLHRQVLRMLEGDEDDGDDADWWRKEPSKN